MVTGRRLIIVSGQEGVGKSSIVRALLPHTPMGAQVDAEDVGQVNPWKMDDAFVELLWRNVAALVRNFWAAGYPTVVAGSFLGTYEDLVRFRSRVDQEVSIYVVPLCASKDVRDRRRIARSKPTSKAWRDGVDLACPEDDTLGAAEDRDCRYIRIDNGSLSLEETVDRIRRAMPEIYVP